MLPINAVAAEYVRRKWDEAIRLLEDYGQSAEDNSDRARMEYLLAELYLGKQDTLQARHYLILASLTDIANAKKVYMSLQHLAILLSSRKETLQGLIIIFHVPWKM